MTTNHLRIEPSLRAFVRPFIEIVVVHDGERDEASRGLTFEASPAGERVVLTRLQVEH